MNKRYLLITFVVVVYSMVCIKASFARSLKDFLRDDGEIPLDMKTESLPVEKLIDGLPERIKDLLDHYKLVAYEYNNVKKKEDEFSFKDTHLSTQHKVLLTECACFSERIMVSYADEREFTNNNLIVYYSMDFYKKHHPIAYFKLFRKRKKAELYFSTATGKIMLFKVKVKNQWITVYDLKNKIGIEIKI